MVDTGSGRRKPVVLFVSILIFLGLSACSLNRMMNTTMVDVTGEEARAHLAQGRRHLARGDYEKALKENEKVLSLAGRDTPLDEALFNLGLIHALPANPKRNYAKSVALFTRLIREYPRSSMVEPAKALVELLQENDLLGRRLDRLNHTVDALKKVDIGVDQKKREQMK